MTATERKLLEQMKDAVEFYGDAMELLYSHSDNPNEYDPAQDKGTRIERWRNVIANAEVEASQAGR